MYMYIS